MNERRASIDIGTNTTLLLIAEVERPSVPGKPATLLRVLHDESRITRLGQGVDDSKSLHPDSIQRVVSALKAYKQTCFDHGIKDPSTIRCVGTSASRDALNREEFTQTIFRETGIHLEVISGQKEAELSFLGSASMETDSQRSCVIDIGGGSTEFIRLSDRVSLDIGSVRLTERLLKEDPPTSEERRLLLETIDRELQKIPFSIDPALGEHLLAVAGTATTLAALYLGLRKFDRERIEGLVIPLVEIDAWVLRLEGLSSQKRLELPGIEKGREDVIYAGVSILSRSCHRFGLQQIKVSTRGLRYGVLLA